MVFPLCFPYAANYQTSDWMRGDGSAIREPLWWKFIQKKWCTKFALLRRSEAIKNVIIVFVIASTDGKCKKMLKISPILLSQNNKKMLKNDEWINFNKEVAFSQSKHLFLSFLEWFLELITVFNIWNIFWDDVNHVSFLASRHSFSKY